MKDDGFDEFERLVKDINKRVNREYWLTIALFAGVAVFVWFA